MVALYKLSSLYKKIEVNKTSFFIKYLKLSKITNNGIINLDKMEGLVMDENKRFEIEVLQRLTKIETLLEDFKGVEAKATEAYNISIDNNKRIEKIEDNNKWLFRTSVGAVITGLIGIIISLIK